MCDFTSENKEEKTNRHLNPNCRFFFAVCIREVSSKKTEGFLWCLQFTGISRVLIPNTGTVLRKNRSWLAVGVYTFPTMPKTLRPGSRLMVVYLAYAGVGCRRRPPAAGRRPPPASPCRARLMRTPPTRHTTRLIAVSRKALSKLSKESTHAACASCARHERTHPRH